MDKKTKEELKRIVHALKAASEVAGFVGSECSQQSVVESAITALSYNIQALATRLEAVIG